MIVTRGVRIFNIINRKFINGFFFNIIIQNQDYFSLIIYTKTKMFKHVLLLYILNATTVKQTMSLVSDVIFFLFFSFYLMVNNN